MNQLPTLETHGWQLDDAEALHARYPDTFNIPELSERTALKPGQAVKLVFLFLTHEQGGDVVDGERMWVRVTARQDLGFVGVLESEPVTSSLLQEGAEITFEPRHVAATFIAYTDPRHPAYAPTALGRFFKRVKLALTGSWPRE